MQRTAAVAAVLKERRKRARRIMLSVIAVCVAIVVGLALYTLRDEGLNKFLYRAPGVGASTPAAQSGN